MLPSPAGRIAYETRARRRAPAHLHKEISVFPPLIAIINDDPQVLTLFVLLLEDAGYRTVTYACAAGAHAWVTQMQPALLILDINMERPDSGWHVLDDLRRAPATQRLPVLIYSGQADVAMRVGERADPRCGIIPNDMGLDALLFTIQRWIPIGG